MKIKDLKTFVVGTPPPHLGGRYFVFLKLVTDEGIEGVGEVYCSTFGPHVMAKMVEPVTERVGFHLIFYDTFFRTVPADAWRHKRRWRRMTPGSDCALLFPTSG